MRTARRAVPTNDRRGNSAGRSGGSFDAGASRPCSGYHSLGANGGGTDGRNPDKLVGAGRGYNRRWGG